MLENLHKQKMKNKITIFFAFLMLSFMAIAMNSAVSAADAEEDIAATASESYLDPLPNSVQQQIQGNSLSVSSLQSSSAMQSSPKVNAELLQGDSNENVKVIVQLKDPGNSPMVSALSAFGMISEEAKNSIHLQRVEKQLEAATEAVNYTNVGIVGSYKYGNMIVMKLPRDRIATLAENDKIERIEPDRIVSVALDQSAPQIEAPFAWSSGYNGTGIVIAILDTGVDFDHPMLIGKKIAEKDFMGKNNPDDIYGHGTHVASTAAGSKANGGTYDGVAPGAKIMNAKVLGDDGFGTTSGIVAGINWAVDPDNDPNTKDGAHIISMSLGGPYQDINSPMVTALQDAIKAGIVAVVAAGNCGPCGSCNGFIGVTTPGITPEAITVGAVDKQNALACFSSRGDQFNDIKPDVVAPGVGIKAAKPNGGYVSMQGTSMATPHVAGAAAILLQASSSLAPAQVKFILEKNALDIGSLGEDVGHGHGLIKINKSLHPSISISHSSISEKILDNEVKIVKININNSGGTALIGTISSDSWIKLSATALSVNPASSGSIEITLDSKTTGAGIFNGNITFNTNAGKAAIPVKMEAYKSFSPIFNNVQMPVQVYKGEAAEIIANVTDDVSVVSIEGKVNSTSFQFEQIGADIWRGLLPTNLDIGAHSLAITAKDDAGQATIYQNSFKIVAIKTTLAGNSTSGKETIFLSSFYNPTPGMLDISMHASFAKESGIVETTLFSSSKEVAGGSAADYGFSWTPASYGNYTVKLDAVVDGIIIASTSAAISVDVPAVMLLKSISMATKRIGKGSVLEITATVENTGTVDYNASVEISIVDDSGKVLQVESLTDSVAAASTKGFKISPTISVPAGLYSVMTNLKYGNKGGSVSDALEVYTPSTITINGFASVQQLEFGMPKSFAANLSNSGNFSVNANATAYLFDSSGKEVDSARLGVSTISQNSYADFASSEKILNVSPGQYTLTLQIDYEGNREYKNASRSVADTTKPAITGVAFDTLVPMQSLQAITITAEDFSSIGKYYVKLTDPQKSTATYEFAAAKIFVNGTDLPGKYTFVAGACDSYNNCAETMPYTFDVLDCNGQQLLVVGKQIYSNESIGNSMAGYCVVNVDPENAKLFSLSYLQGFDAIFWLTGNDLDSLNEQDVNLLSSFVSKNGRLLIEGSNLMSGNGNISAAIATMMQSGFEKELSLLNGSEYANATIKPSILHPLFNDLQSLPVIGAFGPTPDAIQTLGNSKAVAKWADGSAAIVLSNKTILVPFAIISVNAEERQKFLSNTVKWLLIEESNDIEADSIKIKSKDPIITGKHEFEIAIKSNENVQNVLLEVLLGKEVVLSKKVNLTAPATIISREIQIPVGALQYTLKMNSDLQHAEKDYFNNAVSSTIISSYSDKPDLVPLAISTMPEKPVKGDIAYVDVYIKNKGGADAIASVHVLSDSGLLGRDDFSISSIDALEIGMPGGGGSNSSTGASLSTIFVPAFGSKILTMKYVANSVSTTFTVVLDKNNTVSEFDENNNEMNKTYTFCYKNSVLLVGDVGASISVASTSSSSQIKNLLEKLGYCISEWGVDANGNPASSSAANQQGNYDMIAWSSGNFYEGVFNVSKEFMANKSILVEGSDIAFEHRNNTGLLSALGIASSKEVFSNSSTKIIVGTSAIDIDETKAPYPDALTLSASTANVKEFATWDTGGVAAFTSASGDSKFGHIAVSLDAIPEENANSLVAGMMSEIMPSNSRPVLNYLPGITADEGIEVKIKPAAFDPDNDTLAFSFSKPFSANGTWNPGPFDSGEHTINVTVSDGKLEDSASFKIAVNNVPVCGDLVCNGAETCSTCSQDCGLCVLPANPDPSPKTGGGGGGGGGGFIETDVSKKSDDGTKETKNIETKVPETLATTPTSENKPEIEAAVEKIIDTVLDKLVKLQVVESKESLIDMAKAAQDAVSVTRNFDYGASPSADPKPSTVISSKFEVKEKIDGLRLVENIPKEFAGSASQIYVVMSKGSYQVLEDDPILMLNFGDVSEGEVVSVEYYVEKIHAIRFANDIASEMAKPVAIAVISETPDSDPNNASGNFLKNVSSENALYAIITIVVLIVAAHGFKKNWIDSGLIWNKQKKK